MSDPHSHVTSSTIQVTVSEICSVTRSIVIMHLQTLKRVEIYCPRESGWRWGGELCLAHWFCQPQRPQLIRLPPSIRILRMRWPTHLGRGRREGKRSLTWIFLVAKIDAHGGSTAEVTPETVGSEGDHKIECWLLTDSLYSYLTLAPES